MTDLRKTQIATYLTKSDKLLDEVTFRLYNDAAFQASQTFPGSGQEVPRDLIRDIMFRLILGQESTNLVTAETLFMQARIIQEAEGDNPNANEIVGEPESDIPKEVTDNFDFPKDNEGLMEGSDIDKMVGYTGRDMDKVTDLPTGAEIDNVTNYSRTYCSRHRCEDRDITDREGRSDGDEFFCGTLNCQHRIPTPSDNDNSKSGDIRNCRKENCESYRPYPGRGHCQVCVNNVFCLNVDDYFKKERQSDNTTKTTSQR